MTTMMRMQVWLQTSSQVALGVNGESQDTKGDCSYGALYWEEEAVCTNWTGTRFLLVQTLPWSSL
jgi:uncharacterized membrane protein